MADEKVQFKLDLDIQGFAHHGLEAKKILSEISETESLSGLINQFAQAGAVIGALAIPIYAFKKALDFTEEAEQIKRTQELFKSLSAQSGISASHLQEGLEKASAGLITTDELLETANKAIVKMGESAQRLPEIMELARKSTFVFGGDLKSNFENITTAISNGNVRLLKQYGILIDQKKAVEDFAKSHGIAANEISEVGRRQAILNAALAQGKERFKSVEGDINQTVSSMTLLKNTLKEIGDLGILLFNNPFFKNFFKGLNELATQARVSLTSVFGEGLEKNQAQIKKTETEIESLKEKIEELKQKNKDGFMPHVIDAFNKKLLEAQSRLDELKNKNKELVQQEEEDEEKRKKMSGASGGESSLKTDIVNQEARKQNEIKFRQELLKIREEHLELEEKSVQSFADIETSIKEEVALKEEQYLKKIEQIRDDKNLNEKQRDEELRALEENHHLELLRKEEELNQKRMQMLDDYVKNSQNAFDGIGRAFSAQSKRSQKDLTDFGKRGQEVMQSFQRHSTYAFETMGEQIVKGKNIAQAAADAMKSAFLNVIADRAVAEGSMLMLSGIWPPNPLAIGAGAALIALGGAIRTLAGGTGSTIGGASGGGAGVSSGYGVATEPTQSTQNTMDASQNLTRQKTVNVNIAGNLFNTSETQRTLMEMIRQETDATDFNYNKIGV